MAAKDRTKELLQALSDAVVAYDEEATAELSNVILEEGIDALDAIAKGLAAGMQKVGDLYADQVYFVPELLLCSDALYAGLDILKPHVKSEEQETKLKIVIGTDTNPAGQQEYTTPGPYYLNSGATVKWIYDGKQYSASSNKLMITVVGEEEE